MNVRKAAGFTLIEVMVTVALIGILVAVAQSNLNSFTMQGRRSEAESMLASVRRAQQVFHNENGYFAADFEQLRFSIEGAKQLQKDEIQGKKYIFRLSQPNGPQSFYCSAEGNIDEDAWPDVLVTTVQGENP